ncbi:MAG: VWA domain-containing protein [Planctomycetota bacterium]|nr:VWA domain-containing protein [Planctomycetota bacterium]
MNWFPHFLNATSAAIAASIAIPALLVLYFLKLRRREQAVSSTLLWRKAIQDLQVNAPFQKLRRNLMLLLQMLILAALLLALARPVLNYTPGAGPRAIIMIDRSASMSATDMPGSQTRLAEAKRRAKDLVSTMGRDGAAMIIAFDDSAQTVQPFTSDARVLNNAIDSITPTDRKTRLESAYRLADAQAAFTAAEAAGQTRQAPDIYLFSDGRAEDSDKVSVEGILHFEQIGSPGAQNIAIVAMNARRNYEAPTEVQVFARLANYGPDPVTDVQVQMSVDGHVRSAGSVNLLPENYTDEQQRQAIAAGFVPKASIEFPAQQLSTSAVIKVEQVSGNPDKLAADDSAVVVIPPPKILSVLLVTDGNWFLEHGLGVQRLKTLDTMTPPEYHALPQASEGGKKLPKPYDIIVFDRDDDLKPEEVPHSGAAIYFGCVPPGLELKVAVDSVGQRVIEDNNEVLDWKRDHPILRHMNLGKLYAAHAYKLMPTLNSEVLVEGTNCPLMVLDRENRAIHLILPFDILPSNFPLQPVWPIFLNQTLQYMALGTEMDVRPSYDPGVTLRIPRSNLQKIDPNLDSITLDGPMGKIKLKIPPTGDFVLPALNQVGLYTTDPPVPQYENIAVNLLSETESNLLPASGAPGTKGSESHVEVATKSRFELWWWLVAAGALPLLMIEWWVYTRRVHL